MQNTQRSIRTQVNKKLMAHDGYNWVIELLLILDLKYIADFENVDLAVTQALDIANAVSAIYKAATGINANGDTSSSGDLNVMVSGLLRLQEDFSGWPTIDENDEY